MNMNCGILVHTHLPSVKEPVNVFLYSAQETPDLSKLPNDYCRMLDEDRRPILNVGWSGSHWSYRQISPGCPREIPNTLNHRFDGIGRRKLQDENESVVENHAE
jgi:hypothetical protein